MSNSIKIKVKDSKSKFIALDTNDKSKVIAEGLTVKSVNKKAKKTGKDFFLMFVPKSGQTHIF